MKLFLTIGFILFVYISNAQLYYVPDSGKVTFLKAVEIRASRINNNTGYKTISIDSSVIAEQANHDLSSLISENTGIFIKNQGKAAISTISLRGTSPSHTDVQWNGISIRSPLMGQTDLSQIPVSIIDNIDIMYGSSSIEYSQGALGGSILLETKPDWQNTIGGKLSQSVGSYNNFQEYGQINLGNKTLQSKTRLYYNHGKNNFTFTNKNIADIDPVSGELIYPTQENRYADYEQYGLVEELYFKTRKGITINGKYWYQSSFRSIPRLNTFEGNDYSNISRELENSHRGMVEVKKYFQSSTLLFSNTAAYSDHTYYLKNFITGYGYEPIVYANSNYLTNVSKLEYSCKMKKGTIQSIVQNAFSTVSTIDTITKQGYDVKRNILDAILKYKYDFTKKLKSSLTFKESWIPEQSQAFNPSLALSYDLDDTLGIILQANISSNNRFPDLNDLYWQPGGNPDLLPEASRSAEMNVLMLSPNEKNFDLSISGFYADINNWIQWLPSVQGYWQAVNIDKVKTYGMECWADAGLELGKVKFIVRGAYAYTKSLNYGNPETWGKEAYGKQLPYTPVHSLSLKGNMQYKGYSFSWLHNSYSERYTTSSNEISKRDWLYPYFMNNLNLSKNLILKNIQLSLLLRINNIFNEEYRSVLGRPMPGRNYQLSLTCSF
ncbi:MAG: hypothetical protein C0594_15715 [Marinilabiliales bacterium]|nr:MAG: hypothetical protein C0594_15715 [Marinilabiliales bacterium]